MVNKTKNTKKKKNLNIKKKNIKFFFLNKIIKKK